MGRFFLSGSRQKRTNRATRLVALLAGGTAALFLTFSSSRVPAQPAAGGQVYDPSKELYDLGFKFQGSSDCSNAKCHGGAKRDLGANYLDNSYTLWNKDADNEGGQDQHRASFKNLRNARSKQITTALKLADATKEAKCLACHTVNPPPALLAAGSIVSEGVTCNGCHGPSGPKVAGGGEGWVKTHQTRGWHQQQRQKPQHEVLVATGFYDTKPLIERAERCVSCHLKIEPDMVTAGHPQPMFELNWFSVTYNHRHWDDPTTNYFGAQLWAAGQAVSLREAMEQLAERATADKDGKDQANVTAAYIQAYAHYQVFSPLATQIKVNLGPINAGLTAANKSLSGAANRAALAKAATDTAKAVEATFPTVKAWTPDKASVMAVLTAVANQATADSLGAFGIEQQRDAIFAMYNAYAGSADGQKDPAAQGNVGVIGQKLFPQDPNGFVPADKVDKNQYKAGLAEVKTALKV
jgi:hypothetical protein